MHLIPWAVVSIKEQGKGKNCGQNSSCSHGSQCPGEEDSRSITILDAMHMLYSGRNAEKTLDSQNRICICWLGDGQQRLLYLPQAFSCAWGQPSGIQPMGCGRLKKNQAEGNASEAMPTPSLRQISSDAANVGRHHYRKDEK